MIFQDIQNIWQENYKQLYVDIWRPVLRALRAKPDIAGVDRNLRLLDEIDTWWGKPEQRRLAYSHRMYGFCSYKTVILDARLYANNQGIVLHFPWYYAKHDVARSKVSVDDLYEKIKVGYVKYLASIKTHVTPY